MLRHKSCDVRPAVCTNDEHGSRNSQQTQYKGGTPCHCFQPERAGVQTGQDHQRSRRQISRYGQGDDGGYFPELRKTVGTPQKEVNDIKEAQPLFL